MKKKEIMQMDPNDQLRLARMLVEELKENEIALDEEDNYDFKGNED